MKNRLSIGVIYIITGFLVTGIVAILVTTVLIGGCDDLTSPCRSYSFPIINTLSTLSILVSAGNTAYLVKKNGQQKQVDYN